MSVEYKLNKAVYILAIFLLYNLLLHIGMFISLQKFHPFPFYKIEGRGYHKNQYGFLNESLYTYVCLDIIDCMNNLYNTIKKTPCYSCLRTSLSYRQNK
jgi:hypothetical protein